MTIVAPLAELGVVALVLWVVATALAIALIMRVIGDVFRHIPVVGGYIAGAVDSVAQAISNACGKLEHGIDKLIGASWHLLARYMDSLWHNIESQATTLLHMAELVARLVHAHALLRAVVHPLEHAWHGIEHGVRDLEHEAKRIEHRLKALEAAIAKGIGHDLRIFIKALQRDVGAIKHRVIPDLRAELGVLRGDVNALRKWITANVPLVGTAAFVGAVAWALGSLGLGGLRCSNFTNLLGKWKCGLGTLIDDLLGLVIAGIFLEGVCEFLPLIEGAFGAIVGPITHLLNEVPLGACENRPKSWANLSVGAGPRPPAQTLGPLAQ